MRPSCDRKGAHARVGVDCVDRHCRSPRCHLCAQPRARSYVFKARRENGHLLARGGTCRSDYFDGRTGFSRQRVLFVYTLAPGALHRPVDQLLGDDSHECLFDLLQALLCGSARATSGAKGQSASLDCWIFGVTILDLMVSLVSGSSFFCRSMVNTLQWFSPMHPCAPRSAQA